MTIALEERLLALLSPVRRAQRDLADKVRSVADLKGRPLAVTAPGTIQDYEIAKVVESAGLGMKDLDIKYIPFPQMAAAFANKEILDVALEVAPPSPRSRSSRSSPCVGSIRKH